LVGELFYSAREFERDAEDPAELELGVGAMRLDHPAAPIGPRRGRRGSLPRDDLNLTSGSALLQGGAQGAGRASADGRTGRLPYAPGGEARDSIDAATRKMFARKGILAMIRQRGLRFRDEVNPRALPVTCAQRTG